MIDFNKTQLERYCRHIILPEIGGIGQKKLLSAKVLIIGIGGLGSPVSFYLAAAGIGKLGLVDSDKVELNNLQRQIIHFTKDIGKDKTTSAREKIKALNPDCGVVCYKERINSANIFQIIKDYDIVVDGTDNFPTRYLVNDACVLSKKPLSHGAVIRFDGQVTTIIPGKGPCYRCLFKKPPAPETIPSCEQAGIIGAVAGIIGLLQATEVIKFILNKGDLLIGKLLIFKGLEMNFRKVKFQRNNNCLVCGDKPLIKKLVDYEEFCGCEA